MDSCNRRLIKGVILDNVCNEKDGEYYYYIDLAETSLGNSITVQICLHLPEDSKGYIEGQLEVAHTWDPLKQIYDKPKCWMAGDTVKTTGGKKDKVWFIDPLYNAARIRIEAKDTNGADWFLGYSIRE